MNSYPVITWDNLLAMDPGPAVTHSTDAEGYPFANVADWRDYTRWMSSESGELFVKIDAGPGETVGVDSMAIAGHNLGTAGVSGLTLSWSDDDSSYTPCFSAITPDDDSLIFRYFTPASHRYYKLIIPAGYTEDPQIGVLFIGESLVIPSYPDPGFDPDGQVHSREAEYSQTGRLLGVASRYVRREIKAGFSRLPAAFVTDVWTPFFRQHGARPFFFAWDPEGRPEETRLVRLVGARLEAPYDRAFRSIGLELTGAGGE